MGLIDIVVRHAALTAVDGLVVVVVGFGVFGYDVPGVKEAGDVAEGAEEDVYDGVGGAEADFYPDCEWMDGVSGAG